MALGAGLLLVCPWLCLGVVGLGGYLSFAHGLAGVLIIGLVLEGFIVLVTLFHQQRAKARDVEGLVRGIAAQVDLARSAELEPEFGSILARVNQPLQTAGTELAVAL